MHRRIYYFYAYTGLLSSRVSPKHSFTVFTSFTPPKRTALLRSTVSPSIVFRGGVPVSPPSLHIFADTKAGRYLHWAIDSCVLAKQTHTHYFLVTRPNVNKGELATAS